MIPENGRKVNERPSSGIISRILILFPTVELDLQFIFHKEDLKNSWDIALLEGFSNKTDGGKGYFRVTFPRGYEITY